MTNSPSWLSDFFGPGNLLKLDNLLTDTPGAYSTELKSVLLPLVDSALDGGWPIILPWCNSKNWAFYATAQDERIMLELSITLTARLGSADVNPDRTIYRSASQGPTCQSEEALLRHCPTGFIRIELLQEKQADKLAKMRVFAALKDVIMLFRQRPLLTRPQKRPFGRILSDFMLATNEKDYAASNDYLQELRENGQLSRRNLLLLELQRAGKWQNWDQLLNHPDLPDLIRGRIPSSLVRMLLAAYQHRYLGDDAHSYIQHTPQSLRPAFLALYPLFMQVPLLDSSEENLGYWQSWAVGVALAGEESLLTALPDQLKSGWLQGIQVWAGLKGIQSLANMNSPSCEPPVSLQTLATLLQSSLAAKSDEISSYATLLQSVDSQLLEQAHSIPLLNALIESINALSGPQISGWDHWFAKLCSPDADINSLLQMVALESEQWPAVSFHESTFVQILSQSLLPGVFPALRNAMPAFIEWLEKNELLLLSSTWLKWMDVLAMEQSVSHADVKLAALAAEHFLQGSVTLAEYQEFIVTLQLIVERAGSFKNLTTLGEMMELFLDAPVPDKDARTALWLDIQACAAGIWLRLAPPTRTIMRNLAIDVLGPGADAAFPQDQPQSDDCELESLPNLAGKRVAIYTLTQGAARRARRMIEDLFQGIRVDVNHDHTATDKLVNLAKQVDYFIFTTASATHQALYAVTPHRRDLIYPEGKGASSIINAFVSHVQQPSNIEA